MFSESLLVFCTEESRFVTGTYLAVRGGLQTVSRALTVLF
jgi:hypothetical protein